MAHLMWTGSDTLHATRWLGGRKFPSRKIKFIYFLGYTVFAKIADLFVQKHIVVAEHLIDNLKPLKLKKPFEVRIDPPKDVKHIKKIPHKGFNILYYKPKSKNTPFTRWCYGSDILWNVIHYFDTKRMFGNRYLNEKSHDHDGVHTIEIDGDVDMEKIYPYVDFYLRCNRSDGAPRMIMECQQLGIPYYWSKENPNEEDIINFIKDEIKKKNESKDI